MEKETLEYKVNTLLKSAVSKIEEAIPLLEKMEGQLPQTTINLLDSINGYSVMY